MSCSYSLSKYEQRPKGSTIGLRSHKVGLNSGLLSLPLVAWDTLVTETEKRINK